MKVSNNKDLAVGKSSRNWLRTEINGRHHENSSNPYIMMVVMME